MSEKISTLKLEFEQMKDNKSRAAKRLNEISDLLTKVYAEDPNLSSEMWQYIIENNISDNIEYSYFFISQIFNKLIDKLGTKDATELITKNKDRVRLSIIYGYSGSNVFRCLCSMIEGYIFLSDIEGALYCLNCFYEKNGGLSSKDKSLITVARSAALACIKCLEDKAYRAVALTLLKEMKETGNQYIDQYVSVMSVINGLEETECFPELFETVVYYKNPNDFFNLVLAAKSKCDVEIIQKYWIEYINTLTENDKELIAYIREDYDEYDYESDSFYTPKVDYLVEIEKDCEEILDHYFSKECLGDVEQKIITVWIKKRMWSFFEKYIPLAIENMKQGADFFDASNVIVTVSLNLDTYSSAFKELIEFEERDKECGDNIRKKTAIELGDSLIEVSKSTMGMKYHDDFHVLVKDYISQIYTDFDILNNAGFDDEIDERNAETKLINYAQKFLQSGVKKHFDNMQYRQIMDELCNDEVYYRHDELCGPDGELDPYIELDYRLVCNDDVAKLYFMHFPADLSKRVDFIVACILKDKMDRAFQCAQMMIDTLDEEKRDDPDYGKKYESFDNSSYSVISRLIYLFDKNCSFGLGSIITDQMQKNLRKFVDMIIPHFSEQHQGHIKEELYKISPEELKENEYIDNLMRDLKFYISTERSQSDKKDKNEVHEVNRIKEELRKSFDKLARMERWEVICSIILTLKENQDRLKSSFYEWTIVMLRSMKDTDIYYIYKTNPEVFDLFFDSENTYVGKHEIMVIAFGFGKVCTKEEYKHFEELATRKIGKQRMLKEFFIEK